MTDCIISTDLDSTPTGGEQRTRRVRRDANGDRSQHEGTRGWAVVEIRDDGTLGRAEMVSAADPVDAAKLSVASSWDEVDHAVPTAELKTRLGLVQAAGGHLHEAARTLVGALGMATESPQREDCLGPLALIEAVQGRLGRAAMHADLVLRASAPDSLGTAHAQLAKAWIQLERAEFDESRRSLDLVENASHLHAEPWLATAQVLAEAKLFMATRQPDAATRLLSDSADTAAPEPGWIAAVMAAARADALLAAGEPQRALAAVTPLPEHAMVEASVAAAAARRGIGDVRGASAVLGAVVRALEGSPLALQIRACVLESRLAEDVGRHERAWLLVDRALRSATAGQMRTPLRDDWRWLRAFIDREPPLMHRHRAFITSLDAMGVPRSPQPDTLLGTTLTNRECDVLELLAQMYSTEEIAGTLYVSANTVKTHVKGIFGKLCVNRRVDAVRRGRQLGLC